MLTIHNRDQGYLFDPWDELGEKRKEALRRSWAGVFRDFLRDKLPVEKLARQFSQTRGRPGKDLTVMLGVLILQQLHDLTDVETMEAVAFHLNWHYALDIRREEEAWVSERTLRNYRQRVIQAGVDRELFSTLTDALIQAFGVDTRRQRIDSTALRSAMRNLTRLGLFVETITRFLRELKETFPELFQTIDAEIVRLYLDRSGEGGFALSKPSESKRRVPQAAAVLGDTHYGPTEVIEREAQQGTTIIAPAQPAQGAAQGRLTLDEFELDEQGRVVSCPAGHAPSAVSGGPQEFVVEYAPAVCESCPLLARCPLSDRQSGRFRGRYRYRGSGVVQRTRRREEQLPKFRETYRWRAGIEGTISRLKRGMGLARLRIRGLARLAYVVRLRALGLNLRRAAAFVT